MIRADGNSKIGAGHLMRCLAVAEALTLSVGRERICFICADEESGALAAEHGFESRILGTDYQDMEAELPAWGALAESLAEREVGQTEFNVILADSYQVTDAYLTALGRYGRVALMEDFGTHCYPVDCVINYNAPAEPEQYRKLYQGKRTRLLIGSRYVPLRGQFLNHQVCQVREAVRNVLITTGGGDSENIAGRILERTLRENICFHVVTGRFHPHFRELKAWEQQCDNVRIYHDVKDMAGLMGKCDLALTAGGSTIYELSALGIPFICFSYAENQEALTAYIGEQKVAGFAGAWHKDAAETLNRMEKLFAEFVGSAELRRDCSTRERGMTDGAGSGRVAQALMELTGNEGEAISGSGCQRNNCHLKSAGEGVWIDCIKRG